MIIHFTLDGKKVREDVAPTLRLIDYLKNVHCLATRYGCGEGECGACGVLIDGKCSLSCLTLMGTLEGKNIVTIESFSKTPEYRLLERCYIEAGAIQCGYCTPGMIIASYALLKEKAHPSEQEIRLGISGNLCRCTGYAMIIKAIQLAAERKVGEW